MRRPVNAYITYGKWHKIELTDIGKQFVKVNYETMTNQELANALGLNLTSTRTLVYNLGLKRMELEYWTPPQIKFLIAKYKTIGDKELADLFNKKWPKLKTWTHKHIEKKRKYLKLKRSKKEIAAIKERNIKAGRFAMCPVKRWDKIGRTPVGKVKIWIGDNERPYKVIKLKDGFVHYAPWLWEKHFGPIPKGKLVTFKDRDQLNVIPENLMLVTRSEHSSRSVQLSSKGMSDNWIMGILSKGNREARQHIPPELIKLKRMQLTLERKIIQSEKNKK